MTTNKDNKLMKLFDGHVPGTILLATWLEKMGISHELQKYYRRSGWLDSAGTGAFKRPKDQVRWQGALYTLQTQANLQVHVGGVTALALLGLSHYIQLGEETVYLYASPKTRLPAWFNQYNWNARIEYVRTSMLPPGMGIENFEEKTFSIKISYPERAILECLYLAPEYFDLVECFQVFESLLNLRPNLMQELLEACSAIWVKRLFFYMAEKADHHWLSFIDRSKIDLGNGDRSLVKGGVYVSRYGISIPKELVEL
jgi:hypothetical protein